MHVVVYARRLIKKYNLPSKGIQIGIWMEASAPIDPFMADTGFSTAKIVDLKRLGGGSNSTLS